MAQARQRNQLGLRRRGRHGPSRASRISDWRQYFFTMSGLDLFSDKAQVLKVIIHAE